jgi:hypothetical protein
MAAITGTVILSGVISPSDTRDTYAVTDSQYGKDGLRNVNSIPDMLAIPKDRRRVGMMVGVAITANSGNYYYLVNDPPEDTTVLTDWKVFNPGGSITFFDENSNLGNFAKVKFTGDDVLAQQDSSDSDLLNVFIPSPNFASHFNTNDGPLSSGIVNEQLTRGRAQISTPTSEGTPFRTGGWANSVQDVFGPTQQSVTFLTAGPVTGLGGDSKLRVEVFDAVDTKIADFTTPNLTGNATHSLQALPFGVSVTITGFSTDSSKFKGTVSVTVNMQTVFTNQSPTQTGGRYYVKLTNTTDSTTDNGRTFVYTQPLVFLDAGGNPLPGFATPSTRTIDEFNPSTITTKFLSGVQYYTLGSRFSVSLTNITGLNRNSQGRAAAADPNFTVSAPNYGLPQIDERAWSTTTGTFTGWTNNWDNTGVDYDYSNWLITAQNFRYRGPNALAFGRPTDPWNSPFALATSPAKSILVDTFQQTSTGSTENFDDEAFRLQSDYVTSWNSTTQLTNGQACVVGGSLVRPDQFFLTDTFGTINPNLTSYLPNKTVANPNYTGFSADASYFRRFTVTGSAAFNSFNLIFSGAFVTGSALGDLIGEHLHVFVRRITSSGNFPDGPSSNALILHGGDYNFGQFNDGEDLPGEPNGSGSWIRTGISNGNTIVGTLGYTAAQTGLLVQIVIRNQNIRIDQINFQTI